jgi:hypothetical protein
MPYIYRTYTKATLAVGADIRNPDIRKPAEITISDRFDVDRTFGRKLTPLAFTNQSYSFEINAESGMALYMQDLARSEKKDAVILYGGTGMGVGLAVLAELLGSVLRIVQGFLSKEFPKA